MSYQESSALPCIILNRCIPVLGLALLLLHLCAAVCVVIWGAGDVVQPLWSLIAARGLAMFSLICAWLSMTKGLNSCSLTRYMLVSLLYACGAMLSMVPWCIVPLEPLALFWSRNLMAYVLMRSCAIAVFLRLLACIVIDFLLTMLCLLVIIFPGLHWTYLENQAHLPGYEKMWWDYYGNMPEQKILYDFSELIVERLLVVLAVLLAQWMLCERDAVTKKRIGSAMFGLLVVVAARIIPWYHARDAAWLQSVRACGKDLPPFMVGNISQMPPDWRSAWREINDVFSMYAEYGPDASAVSSEFDYLDSSPYFRYQRTHMQDTSLPFNGIWARRAKFVEEFLTYANDIGFRASTYSYEVLDFAQSMLNTMFPDIVFVKIPPRPAKHGCWQFGGGIRAKARGPCLQSIMNPIRSMYKEDEAGDQLSVFMYPPGFGIRWHSDYFTWYQKEFPYRTWLTFSRNVTFDTRDKTGTFFRYHSAKTNVGQEVLAEHGSVIVFCSCQQADDIVWHNVYSKGDVRISVGFGLSTQATQYLHGLGALRAV